MAILTGYDKGVRLQGPVVNLAAAAVGIANAVVIFQISNFAQLVGTKSVIIKRVKMLNTVAGNQTVIIGTGAGAGFVPRLPGLVTLNGLNADFVEDDLPQAEFFLDITAYLLAVAVGGSIDIQVEVEEIG